MKTIGKRSIIEDDKLGNEKLLENEELLENDLL